ncbi:MAG: hypothetical protein JWO10_1078 [Microbacteriaceae bacterium]|nr:hypothetical protein [Microbacteriaceae bacterium]
MRVAPSVVVALLVVILAPVGIGLTASPRPAEAAAHPVGPVPNPTDFTDPPVDPSDPPVDTSPSPAPSESTSPEPEPEQSADIGDAGTSVITTRPRTTTPTPTLAPAVVTPTPTPSPSPTFSPRPAVDYWEGLDPEQRVGQVSDPTGQNVVLAIVLATALLALVGGALAHRFWFAEVWRHRKN